MLEVWNLQQRHAEHFELGVLIADRLGDLIVRDGGRRDAPQRGLGSIGAAGCEAAVLELGHVAVTADRLLGRNSGIVGRHHAQRLHEAIAEIVGQRVALRAHDVAVGIAQDDVALS